MFGRTCKNKVRYTGKVTHSQRPHSQLALCAWGRCRLLSLSFWLYYFALLGGIALVQAIPPIGTHFFVALSVRLSVVCHTRGPCLNRSTDFYAIFRYTFGVQCYFVLNGVPHPQGRGDLESNPQKKHMQLQIVAATWRIETSGLATAISPLTKLPYSCFTWSDTCEGPGGCCSWRSRCRMKEIVERGSRRGSTRTFHVR